MMSGLYIPDESPIHRLRAGLKLFSLLVLGILLVAIKSFIVLGFLTFFLGLIFVFIANLGPSHLWQTTRPLLIWVVFIILAQTYFSDIETAVLIVLRLIALVWAAALVTYTTKLSDMTDCFIPLCRWTRLIGGSPQRLAFMVALTVRLIPALNDILREVRDSQRARGIESSVIAIAVPVLIRVFQRANNLSEALQSRGYERWDDAG